MDLKEEDILGDGVSEHWYYRSKAAALLRYVHDFNSQRILDIGAGSGFFSKELLRRTDAREALCIDTSYVSEGYEVTAEKPVQYRTQCGETNADLVLMMDVLEHVEDDVGLLRMYADKVPIGARFLITVPAFSFLWSGHDVFLGHMRRYRLRDIERVAREAGLTVERGSYYYGLVFPLAAATRLVDRLLQKPHGQPRSQLRRHNSAVNEILAGICAAELLFLKINRLVGLTAFCLARKV